MECRDLGAGSENRFRNGRSNVGSKRNLSKTPSIFSVKATAWNSLTQPLFGSFLFLFRVCSATWLLKGSDCGSTKRETSSLVPGEGQGCWSLPTWALPCLQIAQRKYIQVHRHDSTGEEKFQHSTGRSELLTICWQKALALCREGKSAWKKFATKKTVFRRFPFCHFTM